VATDSEWRERGYGLRARDVGECRRGCVASTLVIFLENKRRSNN